MIYLSVDFGTSAVKISLLDDDGNTLAWTKRDYPFVTLPGEKYEIREEDLMGAFISGAFSLPEEYRKNVSMVIYDTFSPSPVFMDDEGKLVYPNIITHMDRRSRAQSATVDKIVGKDRYMSIAGIYPFAGGCSAMTLLWFQENEPEVLEKTRHIGHLTTFVHHRLTGKWMVDLVNASMMGLYETTTQGNWSSELIEAFGFKREWFPEIKNPGTIFGELLPSMAEKLGVPAGIPVAVGTNDVAAAQMGAGNQTAGGIMNTTGSSEMVSILTDKAVVNPGYYLRNAALPGLWQIYVTTCGGFGVDWFHKQFCQELTAEEFHRYLEQCLIQNMSENPVSFDPYLTGDRQSLEKKTAAWHGLTLQATREEMLAALLQSMQGVLYTAVKQAEEVLPLTRTIKVSGGMATPTYLKLKKLAFPGYEFEQVDNCPILGNLRLAQYYNAEKKVI